MIVIQNVFQNFENWADLSALVFYKLKTNFLKICWNKIVANKLRIFIL